ncbi:14076_t:CDS:2 [Gigaspora rosea]|nr:14076_t:CDS:2 [Gigaspora rosea]
MTKDSSVPSTLNASGTAFPHSQPLILSINTYEDGTALVLIARAQDAAQNNSIQDASCSGLKLEPALRIRVIKLDGTVIEVNYRYNLDLLNYLNAVLYGISQRAKNDNEPDENGQTNYKDHANNQALRMLNGLTGGLFVTSHSFFLTRFSFVDANSKPEFSLPSDTLLIVNKVESIFENDFMITAKLRAFADLIIKNIPLIAIQIIYFRSIVTYSIIPFFVLLTTIFKIILGLIRSIIELLASRKHEENKKETNEEKKKETNEEKRNETNEEKKKETNEEKGKK